MQKLNDLAFGKLPRDIYITGLENFIISTVDFVLKRGNQFFLIRRNEGAFAGEWFVAGGRQNRGESEYVALLRIAKRELGVDVTDIVSATFTHCQDVYNPAGENNEGPIPAWHSKWHFYVIEVRAGFKPNLDETSSIGQWFTTQPPIPNPVYLALLTAKLI